VKSEKLRAAVVELVSEPLVPVIVRLELAVGVLLEVVTVRVELAPGAMEVGLNEAVAPAGRPLTDRFTVPVKPPCAAALTV